MLSGSSRQFLMKNGGENSNISDGAGLGSFVTDLRLLINSNFMGDDNLTGLGRGTLLVVIHDLF